MALSYERKKEVKLARSLFAQKIGVELSNLTQEQKKEALKLFDDSKLNKEKIPTMELTTKQKNNIISNTKRKSLAFFCKESGFKKSMADLSEPEKATFNKKYLSPALQKIAESYDDPNLKAFILNKLTQLSTAKVPSTMKTSPKQYTSDDFEKMDQENRSELINGEIFMMSPASIQHSVTQSNLLKTLSLNYNSVSPKGGEPSGWTFIVEAWTRYDNKSSMVHDIAAFESSGLTIPEKGPLRIRPRWVCEILSPSNWSHDTNTKRFALEEHGIPWYWIVDPIRKGIHVYHLKHSGEHYQIIQAPDENSGSVCLPPFPELEINMKDIFSP